MKMTTIEKTEIEIKKIIYKFLKPEEYKLFVFGSRATNNARKFSDYDIGISGSKPISFKKTALIKEALEESDLPFRVDIVDFSMVSSEFKKEALSRIIKL